MILNIVVGLIVLLVGAIAMTGVFYCITMVPYVPTSSKVSKEMVNFAALRGGEHVYDLGAGDARLLIETKRKHPDVVANGYEISPMVYLLGRYRIHRSKLSVGFHFGNFFHRDVSDADCIFLYLMPEVMGKLAEKFDRELKPGTKVISNVFRFKDRTPVATREVEWISGKRKLLMYEWPARPSTEV
jgi:hypothetical protein